MVRNTAGNIDLIDQLITLITDEEPVQVAIKTTIIRVSEEKLKELGFDWAITPTALGSSGFLSGGTTGSGTALGEFGGPTIANISPITSGIRSGDGATQNNAIDALLSASSTGTAFTGTSRAPGILSLSYIGTAGQVQVMMRGLNQNTGADVMVNPSTITRSGERSRVEVIREFIYPTEYEPPELPNTVDVLGGAAVTPAHPTAFATRNVGVTLEVEPTVGPNKNYIELSLRPELIEFEGFINFGSPIGGLAADGVTFGDITDNSILQPVFEAIRIPNSTVTIQDGHSIVIGGLITSQRTKVEDKVPILGDIPYAGRLFRSDADNTFREAIIISVTAELVDPTGKPWRNR